MNLGVIVIIFILFLYFACIVILSGCISGYKYIKDNYFPDDFKIYTDYFYCRIAESMNLKIFDNPIILGESNCSDPWGPRIEYGQMCSSRKNSDCKGDPEKYGYAHCYCGDDRQNIESGIDTITFSDSDVKDTSCACGWPSRTILELTDVCPAGLTNESYIDYGGYCGDGLECDCVKPDFFSNELHKGIN